MVLADRTTAMDTMPQTVPSAGFTPPCDYSNFADNFDLSLLPGGDSQSPSSPSTLFYSSQTLLEKPPLTSTIQPKIFTTFYPSSPENQSLTSDNDFVVSDFQPDFQKLLGDTNNKKYLSPHSPIHLEVSSNSYNQNSNSGSLSPYSPNSHSGLLSPNDQYSIYREQSFYPSSPEYSLYTPSPGSYYSKSPCEEFLQSGYLKQEETQLSTSNSPIPPSFSPFGIKEENYLTALNVSSPVSPSNSNYSNGSNDHIIPSLTAASTDDVLTLFDPEKQIKQESTVDFSEILDELQHTEREQQSSSTSIHSHHLFSTHKSSQSKSSSPTIQTVPETNRKQDHQLLRQVLRDTSFQKKYNLHPIDFPFVNGGDHCIKMEDTHNPDAGNEHDDLIMSCEQQISQESIEPVLNLAIEQMRKDVTETCSVLGISPDPTAWSSSDVLSWIRWTARQYLCPEPSTENWNITGSELLLLSEKDFISRAPQGGMILYAQLEIWKAAYTEEKSQTWQQQPQPAENISENASSGGDVSEDEDDEMQPTPDPETKPTTSRTSTNIHLWQFLRELLSNQQTHGSCIRWLDRGKGIFKIEDSVKVATLWGKRKNRPAMNYDKLSRSIRQYYKKGIMKKTERSQRLVYQFCHVDKL